MRSLLYVFQRHWLVISLVVLVFGLDQTTKFLVSQSLELGRSWPAEGFFRITHSYNTGSAFGLFNGQNAPLILVSLGGIGLLTWVYRSQPHPSQWLRLSLGLQLGGAVGNLTDRLIIGHVVDFIDVGPWPIFNVADSSLVVGVTLLGWLLLAGRAGRQPSSSPDTSTSQGAEPVTTAPPSKSRAKNEYHHP
jgi:signal peptidase II